MVWHNAFAVTTRMGSAKGRSKPMGLAAWVAIGFASGFAFGVAANRLGLWRWFILRWNEDSPESPPGDSIPIPLKFRRLPPSR